MMMAVVRRARLFSLVAWLLIPAAVWADETEGAPPRCPRASQVAGKATVESKEIEELSGLVASRSQPGVLWVHNDSGDHARLFAIDLHGRLLLELTLTNVEPIDLEDIAMGPRLGATGSAFLYLADTGDNKKKRKRVQIYRLEEPSVLRARTAGVPPRRKVDVIEVRYEDGPHDVETIMVDPVSGDLFLVEKGALLSPQQPVGVYRVPGSEAEHGKARARKVATIALGPTTAGDILPDGSGIAIRNYTGIFYWPRAKDQTVADALKQPACPLPMADLGQQGEALGFTADGKGYVTIAEGAKSPIYRFTLTRP